MELSRDCGEKYKKYLNIIGIIYRKEKLPMLIVGQ